jgi:copper chaperone CopZ
LVKVEGFKKVEVDFAKAEATVTYDPSKTTPEKLADAIRKGTRFKVTVKTEHDKPSRF